MYIWKKTLSYAYSWNEHTYTKDVDVLTPYVAMWPYVEIGCLQRFTLRQIIRVDPNPVWLFPHKRENFLCGHIHRTPYEDETEIRMMQQKLRNTKGMPENYQKPGKRHGTDSLKAHRKNQTCQHLDLKLAASRWRDNKFLLFGPPHSWCFDLAALAN